MEKVGEREKKPSLPSLTSTGPQPQTLLDSMNSYLEITSERYRETEFSKCDPLSQ